MNQYAQKLAEFKQQPGHLLKDIGDQWQTPPELYWGIYSQYGPFVLDLFSDGENTKCPAFYNAEINALKQNWTEDLKGSKAFANPPYSRASYENNMQAITGMSNVINKTMIERDLGGKFVYLIKSATSETWWPENADAVHFIRGRVAFKAPDWFKPANEKQKPSGAAFAAAIAIFDKSYTGKKFDYVSRDELYANGEILMKQFNLKVA
jgi:phage N-6-adenine-methyltransferase